VRYCHTCGTKSRTYWRIRCSLGTWSVLCYRAGMDLIEVRRRLYRSAKAFKLAGLDADEWTLAQPAWLIDAIPEREYRAIVALTWGDDLPQQG
jgi:hypothetical protein